MAGLVIDGKKVKSISVDGKNVKSLTLDGKKFSFIKQVFDFSKDFDIEVATTFSGALQPLTKLSYVLLTYQKQEREFTKTYANGTWTLLPVNTSLLRAGTYSAAISLVNGKIVFTNQSNVAFVRNKTIFRIKLINKNGIYQVWALSADTNAYEPVVTK